MRQLRAKPAISQEDEGSLHWNSKLQVVPSNFTIQDAQFGASLQRDFAGEYADWIYWKFHQQERRTDAMGTTGSCQGVKYLLPRGSQSEVQTSQALQALLKDLGNPFIPSDLQCIGSSKSMDMSCQSLKLKRLTWHVHRFAGTYALQCSEMRRTAHMIFHHVSQSPCPCVGKCKKDLKAVPDVTQHYPRPSVYSPLSRAFRGNSWDYEEGCRSKAEGCNRCWLWSHCLGSKQHSTA